MNGYRDVPHYRCRACGYVGIDESFPRVPYKDDKWWVCPECDTPEQVGSACAWEGCGEPTCIGTPTAVGYLWCCWRHRPTPDGTLAEEHP